MKQEVLQKTGAVELRSLSREGKGDVRDWGGLVRSKEGRRVSKNLQGNASRKRIRHPEKKKNLVRGEKEEMSVEGVDIRRDCERTVGGTWNY